MTKQRFKRTYRQNACRATSETWPEKREDAHLQMGNMGQHFHCGLAWVIDRLQEKRLWLLIKSQ